MARYRIETNDKHEHLMALHGTDFMLALWDLDQWLRSQIKYNPDQLGGHELNALDAAREQLRECMAKYNVSLEMLE
jgi:hypothetical protein